MRRLVGSVAVIALAILAGGCSDDDGGGGSTTTTTLPNDRTAFCAAVQQYLDAGDFSDESTQAAYAEFLAVAPQQIRGAVRKIVDAQAGEAVPAEDLTRANDRFTAYVEQGCGVEVS